MAKKKKNEEESTFDFETALAELEIPSMLKAGFGYYVEINDIKINSEKELEKELTKFKQL